MSDLFELGGEGGEKEDRMNEETELSHRDMFSMDGLSEWQLRAMF